MSLEHQLDRQHELDHLEFDLPDRYYIYEQAIEKWGITAQFLILVEECAELQKAVLKHLRDGGHTIDLANESADVEIMLEQLTLLCGGEVFEKRKEKAKREKLQRLQKRVKGFEGVVEDTIRVYIQEKKPVTIYRVNETGEWLWCISVDDDPECWLDAFPDLDDSINFCEKRDLPYEVKQ